VATRSTATIRSEAVPNGWLACGDGFVSRRGTLQHGMDADAIVGLGEILGPAVAPISRDRPDASLVALARLTSTTGNA